MNGSAADTPLHTALLEARRQTRADAILVLSGVEAGNVVLTGWPSELAGHPDLIRWPVLPTPGVIAPIAMAPAAVCASISASVGYAAVIETEDLGRDCRAVFFWSAKPDVSTERLVAASNAVAREGRAWAAPAWRGSGVDALGEILDDLPVALVLLDEAGGDLTANAAARALFGLPQARAAISTTFERFRAVRPAGEAAVGGREDLQIDGRLYAMSILPLGRMARPGVLWAFFDVTARRAAEQGRAQAKRDALLAQVAGGVGHEFNNLLARVICLAEGLQTPEADPAVFANAESLIEAAESGAEMVRRLMTYAGSTVVSGVEALALQPMLIRWAAAGEPERIVECGDVRIIADKDLLSGVFDELAVNARNAGARRLVVRGVPSAAQDVFVLEIEDDGAGMTPEALARATEPFFTTARVGEGSGLGLSMIRGAMARFGGSLSLASPPSRGLVVTLQFKRPATGVIDTEDAA